MTSRLRNLPKWLQANISCVPASDIAVDPSALAVKWGRWKRAFGLYLVARGQTPEVQKRALFLHCAGMSVQDIFETFQSCLSQGVVLWTTVCCHGAV